MTSASVKDLGALITFVNPSGSAAKQGKADISFGAMMNQSCAGQNQTDIGSMSTQGRDAPKGSKEASSISRRDNTETVESQTSMRSKETSDTSTTKTQRASLDEDQARLEEAGQKVLKEIAKELEVDEAAVLEAMETLGLNLISLLEPGNLNGLILELSSESDPMTLVTNEELFNKLADLTTVVDATIADLAQDMDMAVSDMKALLEQAEALGDGTKMSVEANSDQEAMNTPDISIKDGSDEEGQEPKINSAEGAISEPKISKTVTQGSSDEAKTGQDSSNSEGRETDHSIAHQGQGIPGEISKFSNPINQIENPIVQPEAQFISQETKDIMNQIMDYMKINVKADQNEIEMQLHPASLGNVRINLISKAGEITAEFKVQNETVKEAVEAQIAELKEALKASGNKVSAVEVSVDTQSFDSNLWQGKGHEGAGEDRSESKKSRRINLNDLDALFEEEASEEEILAADMLKASGSTVDFTA